MIHYVKKHVAREARAAEGRRKKSEAAKEQHAKSKPYAGEKMVADHRDPRPSKGGKHAAREARAAEAHVSSSTMARAEFIAKRPEIAEKVRETWPDPLSTLSDVGERQRTARDEARSS